MDLQIMLNVALTAGVGICGWFARELWGAAQELRSDLSRLREELARDYVSKGDFRDALKDVQRELRDGLQRIYDKLDGKADK